MRTGARGLVASLVVLWLAGCPAPPPPDIPPCGPDTLATAPPLDPLDFSTVGPMGGVDPARGRPYPIHAVSFFARPADPRLPEGEPARVPVVAPGRIWLQRVRESFFIGRPNEFSVTFRTCSDVTWTLERLVFASPVVKAMAEDPGRNCGSTTINDELSFCEGRSEGVELAAGTELGLAGTPTNRTLDVSTRDIRAPRVAFANGRTIEQFTCPLDAFDPSIGDALRPLLGTPDGRRRTAAPVCGEYMQDVRGTANGNWFNTSDGTKLALVHDHVDPDVAVISLFNQFANVKSALWRFTPTHSGTVNRDFREVTWDNTVYCYDAPSGEDPPSILLVQVDGTEGLRFEQQSATACGAGPWTFNNNLGNLHLR